MSELGCQVLEAENAAAATRMLEQGVGVDLLFTDVVMPGEPDGRDLGEWARRHRPGLRVLLTSGYPHSRPRLTRWLAAIPCPYFKSPTRRSSRGTRR